jgi:hypothetical protein
MQTQQNIVSNSNNSYLPPALPAQVWFSNMTFRVDERDNLPRLESTYSICIVRLPDIAIVRDPVFGNDEYYNMHECAAEELPAVVAKFVDRLCIGKVASIKIVGAPNTNHKKVYVNFEYWYKYQNTVVLDNAIHLEKCVHFIKPNIIFNYDPNNIVLDRFTFLTIKRAITPESQKHDFDISAAPKMQIPEGEWTSLYIPFLPEGLILDGIGFTHEDLQSFIENKARIGKVRRIDFVDRDDLVKEEGEVPLKAAFIHMQYWCDNKNSQYLRSLLNTQGNYRQRGYFNGKQYVNFVSFTGKDMYFSLKINHKPIPDADGTLNIHQLAAIKTKHEKELEEKTAEIENLKAQLMRFNVAVNEEPKKHNNNSDGVTNDGQEFIDAERKLFR